MQIQSIMLTGRRWFQKTYGNTYHSAKAYVNGELIGSVDFRYGYGNACIDSAFKILIEKGIVKLPEDRKYISAFTYCKEKGIKYSEEITDVKRKGDL